MGLIIRQSLKASISNYIGLLIGYFNALILMPKIFSPAEVGISRFVIDVSGVLAGFASFGISYSLSRYFPKFKSSKDTFHNGFTFWAYVIPVVGFAMLCVVLLIAGPAILNLLKDGGSNTTNYIHIIIPLTITMLFTIVTEHYCALFGRIVVVNIFRENGLRIINLILLLLAFNGIIDFDFFLVLLLFSYLLVLLADIIYLYSINKLNFKPDFKFIKQNPDIKNDFFSFSGIILIGSFAPLIITRSDYFSVSHIGGDISLGIYSVALSIAIMTELPKRVILPVLQPVISDLIHKKNKTKLYETVNKGNINQTLIGMSIVLVIWFNIDSIYTIMPNGNLYKSGKILILILSIGKLFELYSIIPSTIINYSSYFKWNLYISIICLFATLITYKVAVPVWGVAGTAIGVSTGYIIFAIINLLVIFYFEKMNWLNKEFIKMALIFIIMLIFNFFLPNFNNLWLNVFVRSLILMLIFCIIVFKLKISEDLNKTVIQLLKGKFRWF
ncbi:MAG: oligosaccharide flippase family protein [Bacteroidetes bacterium]|nr:oligosaccharide flippase family protein [Bacteroidota bacterium]